MQRFWSSTGPVASPSFGSELEKMGGQRSGAMTPLGSLLCTAGGKRCPWGNDHSFHTRGGSEISLAAISVLARTHRLPDFQIPTPRGARPRKGCGVTPGVPRMPYYYVRGNARHLRNGSESRHETCCEWGPRRGPAPSPSFRSPLQKVPALRAGPMTSPGSHLCTAGGKRCPWGNDHSFHTRGGSEISLAAISVLARTHRLPEFQIPTPRGARPRKGCEAATTVPRVVYYVRENIVAIVFD